MDDKSGISDDEGEPREMVTGGGSQMMRDRVEGAKRGMSDVERPDKSE
jgi:hypothetical protein